MENYISLQKSQLLDSLENQVRFSQLVAVLVGEKGIGKSFTLECLQSRLADEVCIAHIDASIEIQEEQLRNVICMQLGIHFEPTDNFERIESSIRSNLKKKALITIDNAHLLSNECLNSLLLLNQNQINHQESVLFLLLSGDESLPKNISFTETFKKHQEMCVVFQLEAIEKSEVSSLVAAINQQDLESVEEAYGEKQLDYFWQLSKGIPAELEYQVSRWNSEQEEAEIVPLIKEESTSSYGKASLYFLVAAFFSIILFYQDEINELITPQSSVEDKEVKSKSIKSTKSHKNAEIVKRKKKKVKTDIEVDKNKGTISTTNLKKNEKKLELKNNDEKKTDIAELEQPQVVKNTLEDKEKAIKLSVDTSIKKVVITPVIEKPKSRLTKDEAYLVSRQRSTYTLQWIGVSKLSNAKEFKNSHPLSSTLFIYRRKQSENKVLYLVVGGIYSSHKEASDSKEKFKQLGYNGTPWVKSLSAIKKEIDSF